MLITRTDGKRIGICVINRAIRLPDMQERMARGEAAIIDRIVQECERAILEVMVREGPLVDGVTGLVRVSPHVFIDDSDLEALLEVVRAAVS